MSGQEKKAAMSEAERNKIIKAMILAGGTSALIGAMSRKAKSKDRRKKLMDPEASSNAIIVPISKRDFVRDLPTPKELAESRGEIAPKPLAKEIAYEAPKDNVELAKELADAASATPTVITPEDIKARKKEILRGRKFDFFGGQRTKTAEDGGEAKKEDGKPSEAKNDSDKKDSDRVVLRSPDGRFASPTDPVAVEQAEKDAGVFDYVMGGISSMFSPIESAGKIWDVATGKPLWISGGALGSVYIAEKISEAINKRRREKSKARLDKARDKYVSLMEGGDGTEKSAGDEPNSFERPTGLALGTAFFIPAALTALITNRIHENRKADKKKFKEMSDSYPQDPYILYNVIDGPDEEKVAEAVDVPRFLYKTAEGKEMEISAETLLGTIIVKEAMFADVERAELAAYMEKSAQEQAPYDKENLDFAIKRMTDPNNSDKLLRFISAKNEQEKQDAYADLMGGKTFTWGRPWGHWSAAKTPEFQRDLASSKELQEAVMNNLERDSKWKAWRDKQIDDRIAGWNLDRGGILHKIISWLAKTLGFGNWMAKRRVMSGFEDARNKAQKEIDQREKDILQDEADKAMAATGRGQMAITSDHIADRSTQEKHDLAAEEQAEQDRMQESEFAEDYGKMPAMPYAGEQNLDPAQGSAGIDAQNYSGSKAPDFATPSTVPITPAPTSSVLSNGTQVNWRPEGQNGPWAKTDISESEDKANAASAPQGSPGFSWSGVPKSPFEMNEMDQNALIDDAIRNPIPKQPATTVRMPNQGSASWKILHDLTKKNREIGGMVKKEIWNQ